MTILSRVIIVIVDLVVDDQFGLVVHLLLFLGHLFNKRSNYAAVLFIQLADNQLQLLIHGHDLALVRVGVRVNVSDSHETIEEVDVGEEVLVERARVLDGCHDVFSVEFSLDLTLSLLCLLVSEDATLDKYLHECLLR